MGSYEVVDKGYVNTENSQMVSIGSIFTSTGHIKANLWPNSSFIHVVNYSQVSACQGERDQSHLKTMHPRTHGRLTSIRNRP